MKQSQLEREPQVPLAGKALNPMSLCKAGAGPTGCDSIWTERPLEPMFLCIPTLGPHRALLLVGS